MPTNGVDVVGNNEHEIIDWMDIDLDTEMVDVISHADFDAALPMAPAVYTPPITTNLVSLPIPSYPPAAHVALISAPKWA
ncbi:Protein of unknown function [Pyronema omphalodes CBS 100304]|uniref:Uncharacterized protein n=1 Tax=Pyronema omphalodes (strain CBS 100304) TaxID=1076935 RepID=U4KUB5_PYROM|nr:Protein of unknown function [Pyronema omphalodes CBS 100304]